MKTFARILVLALAAIGIGAPALAQDRVWHHASSSIGEPKYPEGFTHFDYVNVDAPRGGRVRLGDMGSFDTFNPILPQGEAASGLELIYETLMTPSADEVMTDYGLLAEAVTWPDDLSSVTYRMNPAARWHDGEPVTSADVVWSFDTLKTLNPNYAQYYANVTKAEETAPGEVTFTFDQTGNRELPKIVGQLLVLPKHYWEGKDASGKQRDIGAPTLEPPLGSGPYRIDSFVPGRTISYKRVPDYWGVNHPTQVGQNNIDEIRYEYFLDLTVQFEAFKADQIDWWVENQAKRWATAYDFPAVADGRVIKELFPQDYNGSGSMVGFVPNLRLQKFQEPLVREALNYAFDFEELNRTLFYGQYERINSFFFGLPFRSKGLPQGEELEILNALKDKVPPEVFTTEYVNPVSGDPTKLRENLGAALARFEKAGYELRLPNSGLSPFWFLGAAVVLGATGYFFGGRRRIPYAVVGTLVAGLSFGVYAIWFRPPTVTEVTLVKAETQVPVSFEILLNGPTIEPVATSFANNLKTIGIDATIRTVNSAQYVQRVRSFNYDMIYTGWSQSMSPGNEQRYQWGSAAADQQGSQNYLGIKDAGVDALIDKVIFAPDRETLEAATAALDRVLLAHHYLVPTYSLRNTRAARWDRFSHPDPLPEFSNGFPTVWWWDEAKAKKTGGAGM